MLVKGDRVKYLDLEGEVVSNSYFHILTKTRYVDVYFSNIKQCINLEIDKLVKIDE